MKFAGWFGILVGLIMFGQRIFFLVIGQVPELPLSLRYIRELHGILMGGVRGEHATLDYFLV